MTGLRLMNEIMDPATRDDRARERTRSREFAPVPERDMGETLDAGHDSQRARSAPISRFRPSPYLDRHVRDVPQLHGGLELHQSVHALRPPPRLQGQFREGACCSAKRRRSDSVTTRWKT